MDEKTGALIKRFLPVDAGPIRRAQWPAEAL
jgi:hypothetical protein